MKIVLGKNIARWRKFRDMTQHDLATAVDVQVGQIGRYERAEDNVLAVRLFAICGVLGVPIADMFEGEAPEVVEATPVGKPVISKLAAAQDVHNKFVVPRC